MAPATPWASTPPAWLPAARMPWACSRMRAARASPSVSAAVKRSGIQRPPSCWRTPSRIWAMRENRSGRSLARAFQTRARARAPPAISRPPVRPRRPRATQRALPPEPRPRRPRKADVARNRL